MIKSLIIKPYNDVKVWVLGFKSEFRKAFLVLLGAIFFALLGFLVADFCPVYKEEVDRLHLIGHYL